MEPNQPASSQSAQGKREKGNLRGGTTYEGHSMRVQ